jgi:VWFA-related protein
LNGAAWVLAAMLLGMGTGAPERTAGGAGKPEITLVLRGEDGSPLGPGSPVFGAVEIEVEVKPAGTALRRIEIFLDGTRAALLEGPPYRVLVNAGQANAEHRFEAVAFGESGPVAVATRRSGRIAVDLEVEVRLQHVYAAVDRGSGATSGSLGRGEFVVRDDGTAQTIAVFEHGDVPLSAVLLLDVSASMTGDPLRTALDGGRAFVAAMHPRDEVKLLLFSDRLRQETPFTNVPAVLDVGLQGASAGGGTALNDALYLALARLESHSGRKVVVLLSDGIDIESVLPMARVRARARASEATIYWLRLPAEGGEGVDYASSWRGVQGHRRELAELRETVVESGGSILDLDRIEQVKDRLDLLLRELRSQYVLGYYPDHTRGSGSWHKLDVQVRGGGKVRAARGYAEP